MKKTLISLLAGVALLATSCGTSSSLLGGLGGTTSSTTSGIGNVLGGVLGTLGSASTVNSVIDLVIGKVSFDQSSLVGTWQYSEPGCAFTSEKLLAQAGGAVAAGQVKEKLSPIYNNIGINSSNTYFTFDESGNYSAKIKGIPMSGTYTFDPSSGAIKMKGMLTSMTGYVTRTSNGMALTFESKKLLTVLQAATALTGNSTLTTIGNLSKEFDGVRVGFNLTK